MNEDTKIEISLIAEVITIIVVAFSIGYFLNKNILCPKFGNAIEKNTKYDFWAGGCFVEMDNGQYVQKYNYQGVNIE